MNILEKSARKHKSQLEQIRQALDASKLIAENYCPVYSNLIEYEMILGAIKNVDEILKHHKDYINKDYSDNGFVCFDCQNKMHWKYICESCSSLGQKMPDGGVCETIDVCQDCCKCNDD